ASMRRSLNWKSTASYATLLTAAYVVALFFSWFLGARLDNYVYDIMFQAYKAKPWTPEVMVLAIDELTLLGSGGIRGIRGPLAKGLRLVAQAKPKAVAVDVILADADPAHDRELAEALRATPNLVLSSELIADGTQWENPRPEFLPGAQLG